MLFMGTIDGHLVAVDAKNGRPLWDVAVAQPEAGYAFTHAPLVVKDKVIVGTAGGEFGIRGFLAAFDAKSGKEIWRFYTIPGPGEAGHETWAGDSWKRGGGSIWVTGSYDPDLNLTYWGIGNAGPDYNGDVRLGDNLYTSSVVALDADTGKLKWHYQFSPHDEFDYDAVQVPVLGDIAWNGNPRKVMMFANRNGFFYVLDRGTGQFLLGKPFVRVNWADGFDENGRPRRVPGQVPTAQGTLIYPGNQGGTNWYNPSFSPRTGLFYVAGWENTGLIATEGKFPGATGIPNGTPMGQATLTPNFKKEEEGFGVIRALDPHGLTRKWEFKMNDITWAGVMTTASDVLFGGGKEGYFLALDARSGDLLWKIPLGGQINSGPMTYAVNGKQYVTVAAGSSLFAFALR